MTAVDQAAAVPYASTVVATGLNNPRGLSFGADGALYIAEAGLTGGSGPSVIVRGDALTLTATGSISRSFAGTQSRLYTGFASNYSATTGDVSGPDDVLVASNGTIRIAVGTGFDPALRASLGPAGFGLGQLVTVGAGSIDVAAFERTNNPAGGPFDSNLWRMAQTAGGTLVTDAGGNSLLLVDNAGNVSSVATFGARDLGGPMPTESVPTGLAVGPDGAFYVGELTGFPFVPGAARIHRVLPDGTSAVFATGFTQIADMAFGTDGSLYVLEYDANGILNPGDGGALWRLLADGSRELVFSSGLVHPTGLEVGPDGAFYVSNFGSGNGQGQVLRIAAVPEPGTTALFGAGLAVAGLLRHRASRRKRSAGGAGRANDRV